MERRSTPMALLPGDSKIGWIYFPLMAFVLSRLGIFFLAYLAELAMPSSSDPGAGPHYVPDIVPLDVMARFDSHFYLDIILNGYTCDAYPPSNLGFFPLYPVLVLLFNPSTTLQAVTEGILISNALLLGATLILYRLVLLEWDDPASARRAVFYLLVAPGSLYFSAVYTESLFLFLSVGLFYAIRRDYWKWAILAAMLMPVARMQGILAPPILVLGWLYAQGLDMRRMHSARMWRSLGGQVREHWAEFLSLSLSLSLLASHLLSLKLHCGDFLALYKTQIIGFQHAVRGPWNVMWGSLRYLWHADLLAGKVNTNALLETVWVLFGIVMVVPIWRRLGALYGIFTCASIMLPITSTSAGFVRYFSVIFPITMMLGQWGRSELVDRAVVLVSMLIMAMGTVQFVNGFFFM